MQPTTTQFIMALVWGVPCVLILLGCLIPFNPHFDPKGDDPYRYCPKEEEE